MLELQLTSMFCCCRLGMFLVYIAPMQVLHCMRLNIVLVLVLGLWVVFISRISANYHKMVFVTTLGFSGLGLGIGRRSLNYQISKVWLICLFYHKKQHYNGIKHRDVLKDCLKLSKQQAGVEFLLTLHWIKIFYYGVKSTWNVGASKQNKTQTNKIVLWWCDLSHVKSHVWHHLELNVWITSSLRFGNMWL